ncbi:MAG: sulfite exporter TauE/SafE family protein [Anaerolineae bacterium]|nr:sulfite exporter TauE/SafE family protein [Anaerolineae bacterium]
MSITFIVAVVSFAVFTQSVAGFGLGLIAMSLLVEPLGVEVAAPLIAVVVLTTRIFMVLRYRKKLDLQVVRRLALAAVVAIPIGVFALSAIDQHLVLFCLGVFIIAYAIFALLELKIPEVSHPYWAYGFGFVSGLLSGAYNAGGPPVVIYANSRRWSPAEFKGNLQGFATVSSVMVIGSHLLAHHYTTHIIEIYLYMLPGILVGTALGFSLDRWINPGVFRRIVLLLLIAVGITLIFQ